jgi:hypothetical protein
MTGELPALSSSEGSAYVAASRLVNRMLSTFARFGTRRNNCVE